ncbi:TetR/AcrR family transcriptional regulator [Thiohalorhabdus sp. Cl-TMA]|uniref:TetR/AcrR family transcriptional regulator n=1 Tax=Thiohalorhabdus methylotrophus TaxID=3242694 RepID=A0ABV4TYY4_9GAMM
MGEKVAARAESSEATRQRILEAARHLFTERGYFNTSLQDIRRESGLSIGSIYHHFSGKEELARELFYDTLAFVESDIRQIYAGYAAARERCYQVVRHLFETTESFPEVMEYVLYFKHREVLPNEKPICASQPFELIKIIIAEGVAAGEIRPMDEVLASATLLGGPIRLVQLRLEGVLDRPLTDYLEETWECAWRGLAC